MEAGPDRQQQHGASPADAAFPRRGRAYYEVVSAFGALAIYKTALLRGARYSGTKRGVPECEHVPFHAAIKAQSPHARIVVAAYLISGP
jgi:hypothetical protein